MPAEYLIYSNEHRAFWRPASRGYTLLLHEAGRYGEREAKAICAGSLRRLPPLNPNEVMLLAPERLSSIEAFDFTLKQPLNRPVT
ncbi:hypothetical protein [Bradyrhizobium sp. RT10b]|uniref:hypothetical protein n=1 Tax=Bradyrhizobium sp. RT10b TaxID=3156331 RepID=UPI0033972A77